MRENQANHVKNLHRILVALIKGPLDSPVRRAALKFIVSKEREGEEEAKQKRKKAKKKRGGKNRRLTVFR
jgi:hypothetical protein